MFEKGKEELVAIFDIGSGSVGGALVLMPGLEGGKPEFIAAARFPVLFEADLNAKKFEARMRFALQAVAERIAVARPSRAFCFLASPWTSHQTREVNFKSKTTLISRRELNNIAGREITNFHREYLKDYPATALVESKIQSLGAKKKESPLEKNLSLFLSVAEEKILDSVRDVVAKTMRTNDISFHSFLLAQFSVTRSFFDPKNFVLIDVGGEVTEVASVSDDVLVDSVSFPLGKNSLIRRLQEAGTPNAETLLSLFFDDRLDERSRGLVLDLLRLEKKHWQKHLAEAVASLGLKAGPPVFFTVDAEAAPWFNDAISTLTKNPFRCIFLEAKSLLPFCNFKKDLKPDPFLIIEALSL
jgi:hypothetical protein